MFSTSLSIKIREGVFGPNFGPNFNILVGGGSGLSLAALSYILSKGAKKPRLKRKDPNVLKLLRILKTLKALGVLDQLSWPVTVNG